MQADEEYRQIREYGSALFGDDLDEAAFREGVAAKDMNDTIAAEAAKHGGRLRDGSRS